MAPYGRLSPLHERKSTAPSLSPLHRQQVHYTDNKSTTSEEQEAPLHDSKTTTRGGEWRGEKLGKTQPSTFHLDLRRFCHRHTLEHLVSTPETAQVDLKSERVDDCFLKKY